MYVFRMNLNLSIFQTGEALQMIRALSKLRSDDHLVQLNASVIRFEAGEIATIDELDYCLKKGEIHTVSGFFSTFLKK